MGLNIVALAGHTELPQLWLTASRSTARLRASTSSSRCSTCSTVVVLVHAMEAAWMDPTNGSSPSVTRAAAAFPTRPHSLTRLAPASLRRVSAQEVIGLAHPRTSQSLVAHSESSAWASHTTQMLPSQSMVRSQAVQQCKRRSSAVDPSHAPLMPVLCMSTLVASSLLKDKEPIM